MTRSKAFGNTPKAVIYGCSGLQLTAEEKAFFTKERPLGFILFARNCQSPSQVKSLVKALKESAGHPEPLILIDQEGGRVARLKPPHWREYPPARRMALVAKQDEKLAEKMIYASARLIASELLPLGINVDCLPLADVPVEGSHDIIGDRAYGTDPEIVAKMAGVAAKALLDGGVLPVLKHIPGHGRATVDSHLDLPVVTASLEELRNTDFVPFKQQANLPLGMTAHVKYEAIDAEQVATLSPKAIKLIREEIGFDGLLMSDDISMKALNGDLSELSKQAIIAGCDIVLHCNGVMEEMVKIGAAVGPLSSAALERYQRALMLLDAGVVPFDTEAADAMMQAAIA